MKKSTDPTLVKSVQATGNISSFWNIEHCRDCPNAVIDIGKLVDSISVIIKELNFDTRRRLVLNTDNPAHHHIFRISISGCPNSCSQPQIKDLGIQGQVIPVVVPGCTLCGECERSCPDAAITLSSKGPVVNRENCLNCGRCIKACLTGVLTSQASGYRVLAGGKLGRHPRMADTVIMFGDIKAVEFTLKTVTDLLTEPLYRGERLGSILEKVGKNKFLLRQGTLSTQQ